MLTFCTDSERFGRIRIRFVEIRLLRRSCCGFHHQSDPLEWESSMKTLSSGARIVVLTLALLCGSLTASREAQAGGAARSPI